MYVVMNIFVGVMDDGFSFCEGWVNVCVEMVFVSVESVFVVDVVLYDFGNCYFVGVVNVEGLNGIVMFDQRDYGVFVGQGRFIVFCMFCYDFFVVKICFVGFNGFVSVVYGFKRVGMYCFVDVMIKELSCFECDFKNVVKLVGVDIFFGGVNQVNSLQLFMQW